ncbi:hypothetical protein IWW38_005062, partial [Coemansia aciculifera]
FMYRVLKLPLLLLRRKSKVSSKRTRSCRAWRPARLAHLLLASLETTSERSALTPLRLASRAALTRATTMATTMALPTAKTLATTT